jgi:hypothetical protein
MTQATWFKVLEGCSPEVRQLALDAQALIRGAIPDATEEVDPAAKLLGFTFQPGTYKGLIVAVAVHTKHVNIMFSKGAELAESDDSGLLEGTGKLARHIKITAAEQLGDPRVRALISVAVARTSRAV